MNILLRNFKIGGYKMDDPTKFNNIFQYKIYIYAIVFLFLSEFIIWISTLGRSVNKQSKRNTDRGSIWIVIIGYCTSIYVSYYFRSQDISYFIRQLVLPNAIYYVGIFMIITGTIIRDISVLTLKRAFTLSVQTTEEQHLIQTGFYKYIRNPAYTGSICSLIGIALALKSAFAPIIVLLICLICYGIRIKIEEKALREQFKQEFNDYCKSTYRLLPFIW